MEVRWCIGIFQVPKHFDHQAMVVDEEMIRGALRLYPETSARISATTGNVLCPTEPRSALPQY